MDGQSLAGPPMTDKAMLEARLRDLVASGVSGPDGRVIRAVSPEKLLVRLLREIDQSIMPRDLRVETGSGRVLEIGAANGRLDRLGAAKPASLLNGLEGPAIDSSDPELPGKLQACFGAFLDGETMLHISYAPPAGVMDRTSAGPSAHALAKSWEVALSPLDADDPAARVDAFMARAKELMIGWILTDMDLSESQAAGDEAMVDALGEAANGLLDLIADAPQGWDVMALAADGDDDMTCMLWAGETVVLAGLARSALGEVADLWRDAMGRL